MNFKRYFGRGIRKAYVLQGLTYELCMLIVLFSVCACGIDPKQRHYFPQYSSLVRA